MTTQNLGEKEWQSGWRLRKKFLFLCKGIVAPQEIPDKGKKIIVCAGMTPARSERLDSYPYMGKGGHGITAFFPLTESWLMWDDYTDSRETEITISTCLPERFCVNKMIDLLNHEIGQTQYMGCL